MTRLLFVCVVGLFAREVCARFLQEPGPELSRARRRASVASALAAVPLAFLAGTSLAGMLSLFPLLALVQRGGQGVVLEDRQQALVVASRELEVAKTEVRRASRAGEVKDREVRRKEADRKLLEELYAFFSRNPDQKSILENLLLALERILGQGHPTVALAAHEDHFRVVASSGFPLSRGQRLSDRLLEESWRQGRILRSESRDGPATPLQKLSPSGGLVVPLTRYGMVFIGTSQQPSERHLELLYTLATQVGLGLNGARYRDELAEALVQRTQALEQLKESQGQLVQSEKMAAVGELAAGVAHELNSPLAAILLQLQNARFRMTSPTPEKAEQSLEVAERATSRAQRIIDKLLSFSRPSRDERLKVEAGALVADTLEMVGPQLKKMRVALSEQVQPASVCGDPLELQQVLTNLLLNAADASLSNKETRPPSVRLSVDSSEQRVRFVVEDSGAGIEPSHMSRVFEPFFTTKPAGEGTGLGLSISYQLVQAHGGTLSCHNLPDGGACFEVSLPRYDEASK